MTEVNRPVDAKLQAMLDAGVPVLDAVRIAAGGSIPKWCAGHGLNRSNTVSMLVGRRRLTNDVAAALCADFGGTPGWWMDRTWFARHQALESADEEPLLARRA